MILLFLISLGILIFIIGIWKRKAIYGKVFIGVGVLLIGIFFFGPFGIFYSCERYSNDLKNVLQKINKPCENSDDCKLISYYPCEPYCINKDVDLFAFYSLKKKRPWSCPLDMCIAPEVKWECTCENNTCTVKEKEIEEERIEETANWKTYRNEEYGFEFKYPANWGSVSDSPDAIVYRSDSTVIFNPPEFKEQYLAAGYPFLELRIKGNPAKLGLEDFYFSSVKEYWTKEEFKEKIIVNQIQTVTYYQFPTPQGELLTIIPLESAFVEFSHHTYTDWAVRTFNQMLSTFRFIEET